MEKIIIKFILLSVFVFNIQSEDIPGCNFFDTVDLTESERFSDGSYKFQDVYIPASLTGEYDYEIDYDGDRFSVANHIRGCVCKLKSCIRFCCHHKRIMDGNKCSRHINGNLTYDYTLNITQVDGKVKQKHVLNEMIVQQELPLPCEKHYILDTESNESDQWSLFENGSLFRHYDQIHLSKQEYCLQPNLSSTKGNHTLIVAFNCVIKAPMTMAYVKSCSVFFMAITIAAYLWLPKFRSLHGKCCNLYFTCLALTFLLNVISMFGVFELGKPICYLTGYAGYFTAMATFLWLSVISFDVWRRFAMKKFQDFYNNKKSGFFNYNVMVWGSAGLLTFLIFVIDLNVQTTSANPYNPNVGKYSCWIYTNAWSAMFYFYSPLAILIVINAVLFFLTTRYIYCENKTNQQVLNKSERQRKSRNRANYRIYLRLFIIMGGSWFLEIIAFICEMEEVCRPVILINDILNCSQGMIIFMVTFCNQEMIQSIRKRIQSMESTTTDFTSTSRPQDSEQLGAVEMRN
ncbi:probable G-protein coupled receptor Mth-like 11 [Drosophila ficusphila]|uniref:probable G-protein coupled receptor Mth-like 11 n=1 Tax=Drosophila ficusphila TaxID=30025 RepID=UPI0007E717CB|nr:probable G-protein coupled receptor Mth-like 11 [Drosophila ficusphila]